MSTEGGQGKYRILDAPPPPDAPGPRLDEVVPEDQEVEDFVIEDLEAADSPTGGISMVRCHHCYCTG